jgi:hypothetical protein
LTKSKFGAINVSYLGYRLTPDGILSGFYKLKAVIGCKAPGSVSRQFMHLGNFYGRISGI